MTTNELCAGITCMDNVQLKVNSLMLLLTEIKESNLSYDFDPSICNDIHEYVRIVQSDCQRIINNDKYNLISKKDGTAQNIHNKEATNLIQIVNNHDHYNEKMQTFEKKIDVHVDEVINSIQKTAHILNTYDRENSLLDEQIDGFYEALNLRKISLNNEIDEFNNVDVKIKTTFCGWKERLEQKNNENIVLAKEAHKLMNDYQQKMLLVRNNLKNMVQSMLKHFSLRAECLKLEVYIIWEVETILKTYKNIDKLNEMNSRKLDCYNDLQLQIGNIDNDTKRYLNNINCIQSKVTNSIINRIQRLTDVKKITEDKYKSLCALSNKFLVTKDLLTHSRVYLKTIEDKTNKNEKEIAIKHQEIEDEKLRMKTFKNNIDQKNKFLMDTQKLIEKEQLQLKEIELKNEKELEELENKKAELQKKNSNLAIMKFITNHQEDEIKEKLKFYHENVILPLELKLEKYNELVNYEKKRSDDIKTNINKELSPELKEKIRNTKLQIEQLNKTLKTQYEKMKNLKDEFIKTQRNIVNQLEISSTKNEQYMNNFQALINYKDQMAKNAEIKQNNNALECKLFQKQYEANRKKDKLEEEEKLLTTQLNDLKISVRQQAAYNKRLSEQYIDLNNRKKK